MRWLVLLGLGCQGTAEVDPPDPCEDVAWSEVEDFAQTWCTECHDRGLAGAERSGAPVGMDFDTPQRIAQFAEAMAAASDAGSMPPEGGPSAEERERFSQWVTCDLPGLPPDPCLGETHTGSVLASESASLCPDTRFIVGDVVLDAPGLECLCGVSGQVTLVAGDVVMPNLRRIQSDLVGLDTSMSSLSMPALRQLDGRLTLERNSGLSTLDLPLLERAAAVSIRRNNQLQQARFPRLVEVDGPLAIAQNALLSQVDLHNLEAVVSIDLQQNASMAVVEAPSRLQTLEVLDLSETDALASLNGWQGVESLGSLRLTQSGVTGMDAFSNVQRMASLQVVSAADLTALQGFDSLTRVDDLVRLENLGALQDASALSGLERTGTFACIRTPTDVLDVPDLRRVDGPLRLESSPQLTSLEQFSSLTHLGGLQIITNPNLVSLNGLEAVEALEGNVRISGNPRLTDLSGLRNVTRVVGDLHFENNAELKELTAMAALVRVNGDLIVRDNPQLDPEWLDRWLAHVEVDGTLTLE